MGLIDELKRRNVFRVGIAYVVLGWLVIQITDTVAPAFGMPDWTLTMVTWFGVIGFPFALLFAWAFELTPEGIKREEEVDRSQSVTHATGRKLDYAIIALLVVALSLIVWDRYLGGPNEQALDSAGPGDSTGLVRAEDSPAAAASIAVLPLTNMSAIGDNVFFAGGVHEEVLTNLSRIENLRVVSRTTAMRYVNSDLSVRDIGRELGVRYIVEGSVRRIKNHVRITVQLIDAIEDAHLWANNYDRELLDVFATQSAVAREISNSLHLEIQPETVGTLDNLPTRSVKAYDLYIKAKSIDRSELESESSLTRQTELLEAAVSEDPEFVEAWGFLSEVYDDRLRNVTQEGWFVPEGADVDSINGDLRANSLRTLKKAVALGPDNIETLIARASNTVGEESLGTETVTSNLALRRSVMDQAIEQYPESAMAWYVLGWWFSEQSQWSEAGRAFEKALELDPLHAGIVAGSLVHFRIAGDQEMTTMLFERLTQIAPETGEDERLGKASIQVRLGNLWNAFAETADEALIQTYAEELDRGAGFAMNDLQEKLWRTGLWELENNRGALLEAHDDLPLTEDFISVFAYLRSNLVFMEAQTIAGRTEKARSIAERITETETHHGVHHHFWADSNHAALAAAYATLGEEKKAQAWVDKLLKERSDYYNAYGLNGFRALAALDVDRAVTLALEEKTRNPTWRGTDIIAAAHISFRRLLVHPDMQAYYVEQGKWIDYLAARVPEYEKYGQHK